MLIHSFLFTNYLEICLQEESFYVLQIYLHYGTGLPLIKPPAYNIALTTEYWFFLTRAARIVDSAGSILSHPNGTGCFPLAIFNPKPSHCNRKVRKEYKRPQQKKHIPNSIHKLPLNKPFNTLPKLDRIVCLGKRFIWWSFT